MGRNIVFFLGAGASKTFGYPLTGEIMPQILSNLRNNDLFQLGGTKTKLEKSQEQDLNKYLNQLYPGMKAIDPEQEPDKCPGILEILSFVEHSLLYDTPPHPQIAGQKLAHFRYLVNRAIAELLLDYEVVGYNKPEKELLKKFIQLIRQPSSNPVTVITTNYDLIIDREFKKEIGRHEVDYGITYRNIVTSKLVPPPAAPLLRLYKLHGSLNWLRCELCGQYYINSEGSITARAFDEEIGDFNTCDCSQDLQLKAVLVAPSLVRDIRDANLLQIWNSALEAIRTAHKLVFIGYSLPGEDLAIKSLILRGVNGRSHTMPPLEVEVVQKGTSSRQNYLNLFGAKISYNENGLESYL
ncbi:MAG: SIR2 family protein [Bacteroidetes bacterium]|nr:SIR2 family protein [Bacteroidota bacterium]